ncbi:MAG: hypothetical protein WBF08_08485 [Candidatus Bathyarchaeia archaeon]
MPDPILISSCNISFISFNITKPKRLISNVAKAVSKVNKAINMLEIIILIAPIRLYYIVETQIATWILFKFESIIDSPNPVSAFSI